MSLRLRKSSDFTLALTSLLYDTFVGIDQTWAYDGSGQEGSMLIGYDVDTDRVCLHWIDTFHNGRSVMICPGASAPGQAAVDVRGSYPAPPGPDWGRRISIAVKAAEQREMRMFNIEPDKQEQSAVVAVYEPASAA